MIEEEGEDYADEQEGRTGEHVIAYAVHITSD